MIGGNGDYEFEIIIESGWQHNGTIPITFIGRGSEMPREVAGGLISVPQALELIVELTESIRDALRADLCGESSPGQWGHPLNEHRHWPEDSLWAPDPERREELKRLEEEWQKQHSVSPS